MNQITTTMNNIDSGVVALKDIGLTIALGENRHSVSYENHSNAIRFFQFDHAVRDEKDSVNFVPGSLILDANSNTTNVVSFFSVARDPDAPNGRRRQTNIAQISALVLDIDGGTTLEQGRKIIDESGYFAIIYTSYSHQTKGVDKYRVVLPFALPFETERNGDGSTSTNSISKWEYLYTQMANSFEGLQWDQACSDISRNFYMPACAEENEDKASMTAHGLSKSDDGRLVAHKLLDWRDFQEGYQPFETRRSKSANLHRTAENTPFRDTGTGGVSGGSVISHNGFDLLRWIKLYGNTFSIERVLKEKAPHLLVAKRRRGGWTCKCPHEHRSGDPKGAYIVDGSEEQGFKFGCSHDTCADRDRLDRIAKLLEDEILTIADLVNPEYGGGPISSTGAIVSTETLLTIKTYNPNPHKIEGEFKTLSEKCWTIMSEGKHSLKKHLPDVEDGNIDGTNPNLYAAFNVFGITVMYDEFSQRRLVHGVPGTNVYSELEDRARLAIRQSFNDMGLYFSKQAFDDRVNHAADQNSVHPVREYLNLLEWDGVPRINNWLSDYAGVEDSEYTQAVGSIFLIAAVKRVRSPGCKFDTMPVFEGPQGCGKSSTVRILASDLWFTDALHIGEEDKKVIEQTGGAWICEIAELSGMSRKELEQVKHSMSKQEDRARGAYKSAAETVPRQFVMFGTTNEDRYLLDKENRRYWPLKIENEMNLEKLREDRDQLWAEAAYREAKGEPIALPEQLWEVAAKIQKGRIVDQPIAEELKDWLGDKENAFVSKQSIAKLLGYVDRHDHGQPSRVKMYEKKLIRQTMMEMAWVETGQAITYSYGVKRPDGGMSVKEDRQRGWIKGDRKDLVFVWIDGVASLLEDIEEGWSRVVKKD